MWGLLQGIRFLQLNLCVRHHCSPGMPFLLRSSKAEKISMESTCRTLYILTTPNTILQYCFSNCNENNPWMITQNWLWVYDYDVCMHVQRVHLFSLSKRCVLVQPLSFLSCVLGGVHFSFRWTLMLLHQPGSIQLLWILPVTSSLLSLLMAEILRRDLSSNLIVKYSLH